MKRLVKKTKNSNTNSLPLSLLFYSSIFSNDKFNHLIQFEKEKIIKNKMIAFVAYRDCWTLIRFFKNGYFSPIEEDWFFIYDFIPLQIGSLLESSRVVQFSVNGSDDYINILSDYKL